MIAEQRENVPEIRRILVTLDASPSSLMRLERAAQLAEDLRAELIGLFVEDANMLRMAELPFTREISMFSHIGRRIRIDQLHSELRSQSDRMRRALADAAAARGIPWTFKVARGTVAAEVLAAASEADLMIVGKRTWAPVGARRLGSAFRMILTEGRGLTLVIEERTEWTIPVTVVFDGSSLSAKALNIAVHLARIRAGRLSVLILAADRKSAQENRQTVLDEVAGQKLEVDFRILIRPSLSTLTWLVRNLGNNPLIIPCSGGLLEGEGLCSLIGEVANPVFLVR
jgi:nucleotide-binding universal stress UspA family protein